MPSVKVFDGKKKRKQKYDNNNPVIDYGSSQYAGLPPPLLLLNLTLFKSNFNVYIEINLNVVFILSRFSFQTG